MRSERVKILTSGSFWIACPITLATTHVVESFFEKYLSSPEVTRSDHEAKVGIFVLASLALLAYTLIHLG